MFIQLDDKYCIKTDKYNFMPFKKGVNSNSGESTESIVAYCNSLKYCINHYANIITKSSGIKGTTEDLTKIIALYGKLIEKEREIYDTIKKDEDVNILSFLEWRENNDVQR